MQKLLRRSLIALAVCLALVLVCYFWIDRPVAFFVYRHDLTQVKVFHWLTYLPPQVQTWSQLALTMLASLVLMNYHFVGDVIAGSFLGAIIAAYAVHLASFSTSHN